MTITQAMTAIHTLYAGNADTPGSSTDDWTVRLELIKAAVNLWETDKGMIWNELWTSLTDAADGDKTAVASTLAYDMPTDFRFLGAWIRTVSGSNQYLWRVISPAEGQAWKVNVPSENLVYVTGNDSDGFVLNFSTQPTAGHTIDYPYYKSAAALTTGTDVLEMHDPYFAVHYAVAKLHEQDGDGDRANLALDIANSKLMSMRTLNAMKPEYQKNQMQDPDVLTDGVGFGV